MEVGDIVFLKKGETAPADLLVIDHSEEFLSVLRLYSGNNQARVLRCCNLTKIQKNHRSKGSVLDYLKILNGKIEFMKNTSKMEFKGFIKLKKDPKGEELLMDNVLLHGDSIVNAAWVYGIVIYAGNNCKMYSGINCKLPKSTQKEKYVTLYLLGLLAI